MDGKELLTLVDGDMETDENRSVTEEVRSVLLDEGADESVDMDTYISYVGDYGRYQILIILLLTIAAFPMSYPILIFYYIGHGPMWKCNSNNAENTNTICRNNTNIYDPSDKRRCHMNRTYWTYNNFNRSTTVTEFDLVCDRSWLDALSGSVVFIGWGVGIIVFGYLSDQYGRKRVMYPCLGLTILCLLMHAFVNSIWMLIMLRLFMGLFFSAPALNTFILLVELVGSKYRVLAATIYTFAWPFAAFLLALKAYYLSNWRTLCILCSAPYLIVVLTLICIPESVRWLNMKGRRKEAEDILKRAARVNKKHVPPGLSLKQVEPSKLKKISYIDLFKRCSRVKLVFVQGFIWFQAGLTYYAINWEFADIGGDMYVNSILSFVVEIPGSFIQLFTLQRFGRKRSILMYSAFTAVACLAVSCTPKTDSLKMLRLTFGLIGKCSISCLFGGIYIWSSEIYATVARTQGMAINIVTSRIGAACSPFVKILYGLHPAAPFILMTVTSAIATFLCATLPETLNKPTRETLDDMDSPSLTTQTIFMPSVNDNIAYMDSISDRQAVPYLEFVNETDDEDDDNRTFITQG